MSPQLMNRTIVGSLVALTIAWTSLPSVAQDKPSDDKQQKQEQKADRQKARGSAATQPATFVLVVPVPVVPVAPIPPGATTGVAPRLAPDAEAIRDTLAEVTEASLTEDGFNDVVERLVDADRNRIGSDNVDDNVLNAAAARVRAAWKSKFGREFDIEDESVVYAPLPVIQGVIGSEAQLAAERKSFAPNTPDDYNIEPGREVAIVAVPQDVAPRNLPEVIVPMIDELGGWKIDIPNTVAGARLRDGLNKHLEAVADHIHKTDMTEQQAYRFVTHHVLLGLMGAEAQAGQSGSGTSPGR